MINIHCYKSTSSENYIYLKYRFFHITDANTKKIKPDSGYITSKGPMIGIVDSNQEKNFSIFTNDMNNEELGTFYKQTNETIDNNNLEILSELFSSSYSNKRTINIQKGDSQKTVIVIIPFYLENEIKLFVADDVELRCNDSYLVPANTAKIIICDQEEEKEKFESLNYVLTYKSPYKNMRYFFSDEDATDYIIQNTLGMIVYVQKTDKESIITVTKYPPKFSFFGALNNYMYNAILNYAQRSLIESDNLNIKNYEKLTQLNVRIDSKFIPFAEFYNFYLNQVNIKLNLYIRQIYGESELYECDADGFDQKNLISLTTPISNAKCKNKKSLFNRLFSFDKTRIISGYISPFSYFDIYAEINNDNNRDIKISPITLSFAMNNGAKYLKKDVTYTIKFNLNHLIKLEPGFNAEIEIKNEKNKTKINSQNPTAEIYGEGYSIISNNDAMVYFFGRLPEGVNQTEIDINESKGKIVRISNFKQEMIIDFGFKNYYVSNVNRYLEDSSYFDDVVYLENLYDNLKVKLVPNEKLYIYGSDEELGQLKIEYLENNLKNVNNDYNIFLVPSNNQYNSIVEKKTPGLNEIFNAVYFCHENTIFKFKDLEDDSEEIFSNSNLTIDYYRGDLDTFGLQFNTNKPFLYYFSAVDLIDEDLFEKYNFSQTRKVLNDLKIIEIADKNNNDNMIKIKFKANYMDSSTRYIIIIAPKNNENTVETFKDACHVVGLINQKSKGVKSEAVYDVGENELIEAEVNITDILNDKNEYIMSIISQELRFEKKIKFYEPKEFNHIGKSPNNDSKDNGDGGLSGTSLALAIILPIIGVIIIAVIVFVILRKRKGSSSDDIEKIENLTALT